MNECQEFLSDFTLEDWDILNKSLRNPADANEKLKQAIREYFESTRS